MNNLFEVIDKTGRKIRLTRIQFQHVLKHKGMEQYLEEIQNTLKEPLKIVFRHEENLADYYSHIRNKKLHNYLKVVVKYLNGDGFVITAYFVESIR